MQSHLNIFTGTIIKITNFYTEHNCGDSLKFLKHTQIKPPNITKRRALYKSNLENRFAIPAIS